MTFSQAAFVLFVAAFSPLVALAAGGVARQSEGLRRNLAEFVAVAALSLTFDASLLAVWGAHAAKYVSLHPLCEVFFLGLQPIIPFLCYFHVVRPARKSLTRPTSF